VRVFLWLVAGCADAEAQALELFEQGNNAFDSLDFEAAARLYDQARQMDPHLLMGHVNYGLALRRLPDSDGTKLHAAAQALLQGIDLNPYHEGIPGAFNHLGAVRRRQGRFEDAVDAYRVRSCCLGFVRVVLTDTSYHVWLFAWLVVVVRMPCNATGRMQACTLTLEPPCSSTLGATRRLWKRFEQASPQPRPMRTR